MTWRVDRPSTANKEGCFSFIVVRFCIRKHSVVSSLSNQLRQNRISEFRYAESKAFLVFSRRIRQLTQTIALLFTNKSPLTTFDRRVIVGQHFRWLPGRFKGNPDWLSTLLERFCYKESLLDHFRLRLWVSLSLSKLFLFDFAIRFHQFPSLSIDLVKPIAESTLNSNLSLHRWVFIVESPLDSQYGPQFGSGCSRLWFENFSTRSIYPSISRI